MQRKCLIFMLLLLILPIVFAQDVELRQVVDEKNIDIYVYNFKENEIPKQIVEEELVVYEEPVETVQETTSNTIELVEDFAAGTNSQELSMCKQSNSPNEIYVKNTGEVESFYNVYLSGKGAKYGISVPESFSLMPGESIIVTNYYNFPSSGKYDVDVSIETENGFAKAFSQEITSNLCNNNYLLALNFNQTSCPCMDIEYEFLVRNTGEFIEEYEFGLDNFAEFAEVNYNPLILKAGEQKKVKLTINPSCNINGVHIVNFYSNAKRSGIKTTLPLLLNINECYDYKIDTGKIMENNEDKFEEAFSQRDSVYDICGGESKSVQVRFDNPTHIDNNMTYYLEGEEWTSLFGDLVNVNSGQKGYTFLDLFPSEDVEGEFNLQILAESEIGKFVYEKNIQVNVNDCYGLSVDLDERDFVCGCEDSEVLFNVYNLGQFDEVVNLELDNNLFELSSNSANIASGESKEFSLNANLGCNVSGRKFAKVSAFVDDNKGYSEGSIMVDVVPVQECREMFIDTAKRAYIKGEENIPISVVNRGIVQSTYKVEIYGEKWLSIDASEFMLMPGERFSFNIMANPDVEYGKYYATLVFNSGNAQYSKEFIINYNENTIWDKVKDFTYKYRYWIITIIVLLVILFFVFKGLHKQNQKRKARKIIRKEKGKKSYSWLIWLFLIIILIVAFFMYKFWNFFNPYVLLVWNFILTYIWYIVIGFVILFVLIYFLSRKY